jgi:DNA-binding GntR family transcriptional regulator
VEGRISRCLLELHDRSSDDKIPLIQSTLAQMLAIRRTTVTQVAGGLEKDGMIIRGRGYMQIVNRNELRRRSCECYGRVVGYVEKLQAQASTVASAETINGMPEKTRDPWMMVLSRISNSRAVSANDRSSERLARQRRDKARIAPDLIAK